MNVNSCASSTTQQVLDAYVTNPTNPSQYSEEYYDNLRSVFLNINPYHFSCPYKDMFGTHATQKLLDCEDDYDIYLSPKHSSDMHLKAANKFQQNKEEGDDKQGEPVKPLITCLFNKLRINLPTASNKNLVGVL